MYQPVDILIVLLFCPQVGASSGLGAMLRHTRVGARATHKRIPHTAISSTSRGFPLFQTYQLIGDSLLMRFAFQILHYRVQNEYFYSSQPVRHIGLCVSGQTVAELYQRLRRTKYIHTNVILLVGTNNALRKQSVKQTSRNFRKVIRELRAKGAIRLKICKLPPIPKYDNFKPVKQWVSTFNQNLNYYKRFTDCKVIDTFTLFHAHCERNSFFERYYRNKRPDRIHLNRRGLMRLQQTLVTHLYTESAPVNGDCVTLSVRGVSARRMV